MRRRAILAVALALALAGGCRKADDTAGGAGSGSAADRGGIRSTEVGPAALRQAYDDTTRAATRIMELFNGVKDEATARAAGPQVRREAANLAEAMKRLKVTVAQLELAGRKAEVSEFFEAIARQPEPQPQDQLPNVVERVATGPHARLLRAEINAVLDAMLEGATVRQRARLEQWIRD